MGNMLHRIEQDIKEGRKKKACDRLRNMINQFPDDILLREKLAQLYYDSGFKDEAGKYWILSEPQNFEMKEAVEIYRKSFSNSGNAILKDIVFRGSKTQLSDFAQNTLKELESDSLKKTKRVPHFKPKNREKGNYTESKNGFFSNVGFYLFIGGVILLPILGFVKLLEIINFLFLK
ncbi:DUF6584 family protein [Chryseobacterium wangxinyae]|uniref:DUF6584 family protein n=1 Tax=Chryseobacterium sp. CY353 TaxID=2997334 RepID=UPI00226D6765|nr:DUF6584 family protein [Chryseobacterium sp. CY353]MCY0967542.1 hypothetical protein [Chryseobacterium sp. CY353]